MSLPNWTNNGLSELDSAMDASQTTLDLLTGTGSRFPLTDFPLRIWNDASFANPIDDPNNEIVFCTSRSGDTCTVVRAQEGSAGVAHGVGDAVALVITKQFRDGLVSDYLQSPGLIFGLVLSNSVFDSVNDIVVSVGEASSDDALGSKVLMRRASSITKQIDATWAVGTNAGMRDSSDNLTGAKWFDVYLIQREDTGVVDVFASTVAIPTLPTNYTHKRRIGSIYWNGSTILAFSQRGDEFLWKASILDVNLTSYNNSPLLHALTIPTSVDTTAIINVAIADGSNIPVYVSSVDQNDETPSLTAAPLFSLAGNGAGVSAESVGITMRVRASAALGIRVRVGSAVDNLRIATLGWIDRRGRD